MTGTVRSRRPRPSPHAARIPVRCATDTYMPIAVPVRAQAAAREENIGSFQGLETGWLARQFLGNRLATSEGAVSNTQLLTVVLYGLAVF